MVCKALQFFKGVGYADLTLHNLRIQGETNETALGHVTGGKRLISKLAKPSVSASVMLVVIPRERNQDVDIQQIHASFLR